MPRKCIARTTVLIIPIKEEKYKEPIIPNYPKFCMIIGQLELVKLTNRKTGKKNVNKQISRLFVNKISMIFC